MYQASIRRQSQIKVETERRQREFFVEDTMKYVNTDKMLATNYKSDPRVDAKRKQRESMEREQDERRQLEAIEVKCLILLSKAVSVKNKGS